MCRLESCSVSFGWRARIYDDTRVLFTIKVPSKVMHQPNQRLFLRPCLNPKGWKQSRTHRSMWSEILLLWFYLIQTIQLFYVPPTIDNRMIYNQMQKYWEFTYSKHLSHVEWFLLMYFNFFWLFPHSPTMLTVGLLSKADGMRSLLQYHFEGKGGTSLNNFCWPDCRLLRDDR